MNGGHYHQGSKRSDSYRRIVINRKEYAEHRLAFLYIKGRWPLKQVDHINGREADNRWANLRDVSVQENQRNTKIGKANKSGVIGVVYHKQMKKWQAQIKIRERVIYLGLYSDIQKAAEARKAAEIRYGFHANHGRIAESVIYPHT